MDRLSISFADGSKHKWADVQGASIERKYSPLGSGMGVERFYLIIRTTAKGRSNSQITSSTFEITGLDHSPKQILTLIELFRNAAIQP